MKPTFLLISLLVLGLFFCGTPISAAPRTNGPFEGHSRLLQDSPTPTRQIIPSETKNLATEPNDSEIETLESLLAQQVKAWNEGDLVGFMQAYWKSDELTFSSGGKTTCGWQATLDNYKKSYAPPKQMGQLTFDQLEITRLETSTAMILGQWHLTMENDENLGGNFSLILRKIDGHWKIIHDHSSS